MADTCRNCNRIGCDGDCVESWPSSDNDYVDPDRCSCRDKCPENCKAKNHKCVCWENRLSCRAMHHKCLCIGYESLNNVQESLTCGDDGRWRLTIKLPDLTHKPNNVYESVYNVHESMCQAIHHKCLCDANSLMCQANHHKCSCIVDGSLCKAIYHKCLCDVDGSLCQAIRHKCMCKVDGSLCQLEGHNQTGREVKSALKT
jgi:hypothetical protein